MVEKTTASSIALFPLNTVLFPGNRLPLRIFEPRYVDMVGQCMRDSTGFGVVGIESGNEAGGATPKIFSLGTLANIVDFDQGRDGLLHIVIEGQYRFDIISTSVDSANLLHADIFPKPILEMPKETETIERILSVYNTLKQHPEIGSNIRDTTDPVEIAYQIVPFLPLDPVDKVALLSLDSAQKLFRCLEEHLENLQSKPV